MNPRLFGANSEQYREVVEVARARDAESADSGEVEGVSDEISDRTFSILNSFMTRVLAGINVGTIPISKKRFKQRTNGLSCEITDLPNSNMNNPTYANNEEISGQFDPFLNTVSVSGEIPVDTPEFAEANMHEFAHATLSGATMRTTNNSFAYPYKWGGSIEFLDADKRFRFIDEAITILFEKYARISKPGSDLDLNTFKSLLERCEDVDLYTCYLLLCYKLCKKFEKRKMDNPKFAKFDLLKMFIDYYCEDYDKDREPEEFDGHQFATKYALLSYVLDRVFEKRGFLIKLDEKVNEKPLESFEQVGLLLEQI